MENIMIQFCRQNGGRRQGGHAVLEQHTEMSGPMPDHRINPICRSLSNAYNGVTRSLARV